MTPTFAGAQGGAFASGTAPTFGQQGGNATGIAFVAAVHVLLGWALVSGSARSIIDMIKVPVEVRLVEEIKPPPPPPPPKLEPLQRKQVAAPPPPSYAPPPEIAVAPTPDPAPVITTTAVAPPPAPMVVATAAPVAAAPATVARPTGTPARIDVSSCEKPEYPSAAARVDASGTTKIRFAVDATGVVSKADVEKTSGPLREHRLLDRAAVAALSKCHFTPGTGDDGAPVGAFAIVDYVWRVE